MKKLILISVILAYSLTCFSQKKEWKKARELNTIEAYQKFLESYPSSKYSKTADLYIEVITTKNNAEKEWEKNVKKEWEEAQKVNTIDYYVNFLNKYPESEYSEEALNRASALASDDLNYEKVRNLIKTGKDKYDKQEYANSIKDGTLKENNENGIYVFEMENCECGHNWLSRAVQDGDVELLKILLKINSNPNINFVVEELNIKIPGGISLAFFAGDGSSNFIDLGNGRWYKGENGKDYTNFKPKYYKTTPLILAVKNNQYEMITLLMEYGADKTMVDSEDKTAYDYAKNNEIKTLLNTTMKSK